jgi:hypothetical protein
MHSAIWAATLIVSPSPITAWSRWRTAMSRSFGVIRHTRINDTRCLCRAASFSGASCCMYSRLVSCASATLAYSAPGTGPRCSPCAASCSKRICAASQRYSIFPARLSGVTLYGDVHDAPAQCFCWSVSPPPSYGFNHRRVLSCCQLCERATLFPREDHHQASTFFVCSVCKHCRCAASPHPPTSAD